MNTRLKEAFIKLLAYDDQITTLFLEEILDFIHGENEAVELCEKEHNNCPTSTDYIFNKEVFKATSEWLSDAEKAFIIDRAEL